MVEQDNESNIAPVTNAIKEHTCVEHESVNGKNIEKNETRGVDKQPSTLSPTLEEQHEEPQVSPFINAATKYPKTIHTLDKASESDVIIDSELE